MSLAHTFKKGLGTTPGTLVVHLVVICVAAVLLLIATLFGVHEQREVLNVVCKDTVPSILAAQRIKAALADLDAHVADELLSAPGQNPGAVKAFEDGRRDLGENLVTASENITHPDDDRTRPLRAIVTDLTIYLASVERSRLLHQQKNGEFMAVYMEATALLHATLLTQADALETATSDTLDDAYDRQRKIVNFSLILVILHGAILLACLVATQMFLARKTRRTLNGGLVAATVVTVLLLSWTVSCLMRTSADLQVAKAKAFNSLHALWMARAAAFDANGAESRWLLARTTGNSQAADSYQREFLAKDILLISVPAGDSVTEVAAALKAGKALPTGCKGYLADELGQDSFEGEAEVAGTTLNTYLDYHAIDGKIRQLENSGAHQDAITLCCGNRPGQSNYAFDQFNQAIGKTIDLNQQHFDAAYQDGMKLLRAYEWKAAVAILLVCLGCYLGLRPRLLEYSVG